MQTYDGNTTIISTIGTNPAERGLTTEQFKAKFDEGLKTFVEWFNTDHKAEIEALGEPMFLKMRGVRYNG